MTSWTDHDLRAIAETPDLFVSPFREDGTTYGTPTRVWPLVVDGDVYVRAANGQQSSWYQAAIRQEPAGSASSTRNTRSRSSRPAAR